MKAAIALAIVLSLGCVSASPTFGSIAANKVSSTSLSYNYYDANVCSTFGYSIREDLQTSIFEEVEQQFLQYKCDSLNSYSVYPRDIGCLLDEYEPDSLVYDIIMVGGGPAGLTAIPQLLELEKKILIVEQGTLPPISANSIHYRTKLYDNTDYVRAFDAYVNGDITRKLYTGTCLGGKSVYDQNPWNIGSYSFYERLGEINEEWAWQKASCFYKSLESYESYGSSSSVSTSQSTTSVSSTSVSSSSASSSSSSSSSSIAASTYSYSTEGRFKIFDSYEENRLCKTISSVFEELGYCKNTNSFNLTPGYTVLPTLGNIKGTTSFPHTIFSCLESTDNIDLSLRTKVNRILFNGNIATGVEVTTVTGQVKTVLAREQVILTNDAVSAYQLLFQSGCGPQDLLTQFGMPINIPISFMGQELCQPCVYYGIVVTVPKNCLLSNYDSDARNLAYALGDSTLSPSDIISNYRAFLTVNGASESNVVMKLHAYSQSTLISFQTALHHYFQYDSYTQEFLLEKIQDYDILIIGLQLTNPLSKGYITYQQSCEKPYINLGFFNEDQDVQCMLEAIEQTRAIVTTQTFSSLGAEILQLPIQNSNGDYFSQEFNRQSILRYSIPTLYSAGGLPMGNVYEKAVVDKALRLVGTQNCRIFSNAVLPFHLPADSIAFSTMIGLYGAQTLVNEYNGNCFETISISNSISTSSTSIESSSYAREIDSSSFSSSSVNAVNGISGIDTVSALDQSSVNIESSHCESDIDINTINGISGIGGVSAISESSTNQFQASKFDSSSTYLDSSANGYCDDVAAITTSEHSISQNSYDYEALQKEYSNSNISSFAADAGEVAQSSISQSSYDYEASKKEYSSSNISSFAADAGEVAQSSIASSSASYAKQSESSLSSSATSISGVDGFASNQQSSSYQSEFQAASASHSEYQSNSIASDIVC